MLDQLVESKSHAAEDTKRSGFLLTTMVVMVTILLSAWLYSLFAKNFDMGADDLSLQTLVAPPVIEEAPEPEPEKQPEPKDPDVDIRKELIQNILSTPVEPPKETSTRKNPFQEMRLDRMTKLGSADLNTGAQVAPDRARITTEGGSGSGGGPPGAGGETGGGGPPPPPPAKKPPSRPISGGVLNGKARSLPQPTYPAAARAVRAQGNVTVQVVIDEQGNVTSASAAGGHALLKPAAVAAARRAKFSPTLLSGQPVKVSGVIVYKFSL